ncbi:MAG: hypothetical protein Lokiarch_01150 [Candidatus Lokiarchaeum sp. GC14_75]|nr:MAG: hypothetical protein Lokiarch_01150 [Candidatus Lokiarchaeum sp. GC14_75]
MIYKILMYYFEEDDKNLARYFEMCLAGNLIFGDRKR